MYSIVIQLANLKQAVTLDILIINKAKFKNVLNFLNSIQDGKILVEVNFIN